MALKFKPLAIPEVREVRVKMHEDGRGAFAEMYKRSEFAAAGIKAEWVQVNYSRSRQGVVRGLHYQLEPYAQAKLVAAVAGEVFDAAVDLRQGSPTFGRWAGVALKAKERNAVYVPAGFAHGFYVLSAVAEIIYFCSSEYAPGAERGVVWNDPGINIAWPSGGKPVLSAKDSQFPCLKKAEINFNYPGGGGKLKE